MLTAGKHNTCSDFVVSSPPKTNRTCAVADVGNTSMCVQLASLGVDSWQLLAVCPKRSSGVNWSDMSLRLESGSIEMRQADMMAGTSLGQEHISRSCLLAFFRALRPSKTLQPRNTFK
jgi:hypothetical protein